MKLDIDWAELAKALWKAVWPFIAGAVNSPVPQASGCPRAKPEPRSGRKRPRGLVSGCTFGGIGPNFLCA